MSTFLIFFGPSPRRVCAEEGKKAPLFCNALILEATNILPINRSPASPLLASPEALLPRMRMTVEKWPRMAE